MLNGKAVFCEICKPLRVALLKEWGGDVEQEKATGGIDPETA
ncbi:hypothetical protein ACFQ3K_07685 [Brucella gallinifaecis]|nr:hypothetical protein [Brucella gallinifaecis]